MRKRKRSTKTTSVNLVSFINDEIEANRDNLDFECLKLIDNNPNMMVPWFLMAAYAYYEEDDPILSDALFDKISKRMYDQWDNIEHQHKYLIDKDKLRAGSYLGEYPERTKGGLKYLRSIYEKRNRRTRGNR